MTAVHESSAEFPADVSEVEQLGLETLASEKVKPPRIARAPIAMECRFRQCIEFGETRSRLIVGEVCCSTSATIFSKTERSRPKELDPIARIAGPRYARLGEIFTLKSVFQTSKSAPRDQATTTSHATTGIQPARPRKYDAATIDAYRYSAGERTAIIVSCMLGFALDLYDVLIMPFLMGSIQKSLGISLTRYPASPA